jgi:hypothetical protein
MWYFAENNTQQGPVDLEEIKTLIAQERIKPTTLVWTSGMANWTAIAETELKDLLIKEDLPPQIPGSYPPIIPQPAGVINPTETSIEIEQLKTWFTIYWICLAAGIPLTVIAIGFFGIIAAIVFAYLMLYKFWKIIQDGEARTTPGKAVGFMFIPFFSLYWIFEAYWGLAKDMNKYTLQRNISAPKINEDFILAYCIVSCVTGVAFIVPALGGLLSIASLVLWILAMMYFKNTAVAIMKAKIRKDIYL